MKFARSWVLGAALLMAAAPVFAQGGPGGGRRGGGFGGPMSLLGITEVQKELKLEPAQVTLLQQLSMESRQNGREFFQGLRDLSPEEREKKIAAYRMDQEKKIGEILDAKQMSRLKQLEIQQEGTRALTRKDVQDSLKLSADQRQKIDAAVQAERTAMRAAFESAREGGDRQAAFEKLRTLRQETETKLNGILTPQQKTSFTSMQGAPFKFPERRFGPGGQGGRRRDNQGGNA